MGADCSSQGDDMTINGTCPIDCGDCDEGEIADCTGGCYLATWLGDGNCDDALNCPMLGNDLGDCEGGSCGDFECDPGEGALDAMLVTVGCSVECGSDETCLTDCLIEETGLSWDCSICYGSFLTCTDEVCGDVCGGDDNAACATCLETQGCVDAIGTCTLEGCSNDADNAILWGTCPADCSECAGDTIGDCWGGCTSSGWIGDGSCDDSLNCEDWGWDGGDCLCADDEIPGCDGGCAKAEWLGDDYCNVVLDCVEYEHDGGDCDFCGNDTCGEGREPLDLPRGLRGQRVRRRPRRRLPRGLLRPGVVGGRRLRRGLRLRSLGVGPGRLLPARYGLRLLRNLYGPDLVRRRRVPHQLRLYRVELRRRRLRGVW